MAFDSDFEKSSFKFWDGYHCLKQDSSEYFPMFGSLFFVGEQGSGKSLSAHRLIAHLLDRYPELTLISNTDIPYHDYIKYENIDTIRNVEKKGIILYLDEISNMFNSLDSKSIDSSFFEISNMMRKRRLLLVATAPIFSRIAKVWREQFDTICICRNILGCFQINHYYKCNVDTMCLAETTEDAIAGLKPLRTHFFFHSLEDYNRYNTFTLVTKRGESVLC